MLKDYYDSPFTESYATCPRHTLMVEQRHGVDVCGEKQEDEEGVPSSVLTVGLPCEENLGRKMLVPCFSPSSPSPSCCTQSQGLPAFLPLWQAQLQFQMAHFSTLST